MQVKLTPEAVVAVFNAKRGTVKKHIGEMRTALVAAAQLVPWLQDINRNNVTSHLRVIIEVARAMPPAHAGPRIDQADTADQNVPPSSPGQTPTPECGVTAGVTDTTVLAEHNQQIGLTPSGESNRKRQRREDQVEAMQTARKTDSSVGVQSSAGGSKFVVADLDSKQFAEETVIKEHEWPQYIHMPKRLRCSTGSHIRKAPHPDIPAC